MKLIKFNDKYFLYKNIYNISMVVTTANSDFGIHPKFSNYKDVLEFIKVSFKLSEIYTVSQTHSNIVHVCNDKFVSGTEGDGLITNEKNIAVGVFTADCAPIFLFDRKKQIVSAVHSGWRGIYKEIVLNAIDIFVKKYNSNLNDIIIYIGPHNMKCCYEIQNDLREKFLNHNTFKNNPNIFYGNNLNMIECIRSSVLRIGISEQNIYTMNYCTHCSDDVKFYSYRRDKESLNRIFSFIFIN